jgi:hypothetical protein
MCAVDVTFSYLKYFHNIGLLDLLSQATTFPGAGAGHWEGSLAKQIQNDCTLLATLPSDCGFSAWSLLRTIGYLSSRPDASISDANSVLGLCRKQLALIWAQRTQLAEWEEKQIAAGLMKPRTFVAPPIVETTPTSTEYKNSHSNGSCHRGLFF